MTANKTNKGTWLNRSIKFHKYINRGAAFLYKQVRKIEYAVASDDAMKNLDNFVEDAISVYNRAVLWDLGSSDLVELSGNVDKDDITLMNLAKENNILYPFNNSFSPKEKLISLGKHYLSLADVKTLDDNILLDCAFKYDFKGLVPGLKEELSDFVYRSNSMLFLHRMFRERKIKPKITVDESDFDVSIKPVLGARLIKKEDLAEASSKIPYHMDLSWVAGFIGDGDTGILAGAYGVCFTLPKYAGLNFLMMRDKYKTREQFIDVLSHEMAHMGTVYLDTKQDFLETKAYAVGSAAFGEYTIATNKRPNMITRSIRWGLEYILHINLPNSVISMIPKLHSALSIASTRNVYATTKVNLYSFFGEEKGNYILGRLSADEIEEFCYTNNLSARLAKKDSLKWKIIKHNLSKLEEITQV